MDATRILKRKIFLYATICLLSFAGMFLVNSYKSSRHELDEKKRILFEKILRKKEHKLQNLLQLAATEKYYKVPFNSLHAALEPELWQKEGLTLFLYKNDSLIYWSNNNVPAENLLNKTLFTTSFIRYGNGWFRVMTGESEKIRAVGLALVKYDYPYQNQYLVNEFQRDFKMEPGVTVDTIPGSFNILTDSGEFLFSLNADKSPPASGKTDLLAFVLWIVCFISMILVLYYLYHLFEFFRTRPTLLLLAFAFDAILLRFIFLYFEIPAFLVHSDLFSPYYFATSFISPSLADLLINSVFWLTLAWIFFNKCQWDPSKLSKQGKIVLSTVLSLAIAWLFYLLINTLRRMVIDSHIEFNLNNIFNTDLYSGLGFLSMSCLVMAYFLFSARLLSIITINMVRSMVFVLISAISALFLMLIFFFEQNTGPGLVFGGILFMHFLTFIYFSKLSHGFKNITGALVYIVIFSLLVTFILDYYHHLKEKEIRKSIAGELSSKRDPLLEYEFSGIAKIIAGDSAFIMLLNEVKNESKTEDKLADYLRENYFSNFWNKYDFVFTYCNKNDVLNIQPEGYLENCLEYFSERINLPGAEPAGTGLFFLNDRLGNSNYLAKLQFDNGETDQYDSLNLFIEIYQKYVSETGLGYPDLLIDQKVKQISKLGDYSYAKYFNDKLIYKNGDFSYRLSLESLKSGQSSGYFVDSEGYNHYIQHVNAENTLVISRKNLTFLDLAAPFSYLFILFSFFLLLFLLVHILTGRVNRIEFNFSNQLQITIISIIIISFFILGIITRANIIHLYNNKNRDNLSEKAFSVLTEIEHKLANVPEITDDLKVYVSELLYKFSVVFFTDINLFDVDGNLIASSRPQIFNQELLSAKINPAAFYQMTVNQSLLYIQIEKTGDQEYLSAYIPFRNNQDQIIAYLNLPYFAKQTELRKEIGDFLAAYINVYVLLIVLAIMATILVSRFISRPLQLIREKLRQIGLGKPNEKIEWKRNDEIGYLVDEYNRMIDELARSAELLAQSERESAWREMAKQVAHEIKNPLTPMKLSVQYLQKTWDEKSPDWEKHLKRFSRTIIEQIDSLSAIASEFSDFAKMPAAHIEKTGLVEIVNSAADLYHHHQVAITVHHSGDECFVPADKKQLLRAFNNLIQNAVQAIGKREDGWIRIDIDTEGDNYRVSIKDNGSGITEEQAVKIFSPSFTTKSGGTGLGLAMVKSILSTIGATITFESRAGEGTTFILRIPAYRD